MQVRWTLTSLLSTSLSCVCDVGDTGGRIDLEVDVAAVRDLGWVEAGASDEEACLAAFSRAQSLASATGSGASELSLEPGDAGRTRLDLPPDMAPEERRALESALLDVGRLEFRMVATEADLAALGTSGPTEREKLERWHGDHPDASLGEFARISPVDGGPSQRLRWCERVVLENEASSAIERAMLLIEPTMLEECFGASDFEQVYFSSDTLGYPAIGFEFRDELKPAFRAFTAQNVDRQMAILIRDVVISAPSIAEPLPAAGIIRGQFTNEEVELLLETLKSGDMPGPFRRVADR